MKRWSYEFVALAVFCQQHGAKAAVAQNTLNLVLVHDGCTVFQEYGWKRAKERGGVEIVLQKKKREVALLTRART
jgi:hypothetical protein